MSEAVFQALGAASVGYVVAPAGCGKTEAIVQAVSRYCIGKQLILTHTHAGVSALKRRFQTNAVDSKKYHIETISGWALGWVKSYPTLAGYIGNLPLPEGRQWSLIYRSATALLALPFVQWVIKNSYAGVIIDEYQDCTVDMHSLVLELKALLPCRILGDPLQGIFTFNDPLVSWTSVESDFSPNLGLLNEPHRWINVSNRCLGDWLIRSRIDFEKRVFPDYTGSPINLMTFASNEKTSRLQTLTRSLSGSICVIGAKHGKFNLATGSALVNAGFWWVEPNDLPDLKELLEKLLGPGSDNDKAEATITFLKNSFTALASGTEDFIRKLFLQTITRRPTINSRLLLWQRHSNGFSPTIIPDIIDYILSNGTKCKKIESITYLKRVIEQHVETGESLSSIFAKEIAARKVSGKFQPRRCIGTTLLLKGLEFDHAIILYNQNDNAWQNPNDMYVALTRGCRSVYLIS